MAHCNCLHDVAVVDFIIFRLDKQTRLAIESLGSSYITLLAFRDVWAFIGQKGIHGYSPLEQVEQIFSNRNLLFDVII